MGVGAGLYMYVVVVQKFTFAISSPDEFLFLFGVAISDLNVGIFAGQPAGQEPLKIAGRPAGRPADRSGRVGSRKSRPAPSLSGTISVKFYMNVSGWPGYQTA